MATVRYPISTDRGRGNTIALSGIFRLRHCHHATATTIDQPIPIKRRFDPVMLASAKEHGDSPVAPGAWHTLPNCLKP